MACLLACLLTHVLTHSLLACAHLHLRIYVRAYLRTHSHTHSRHSHTHTHTHTHTRSHTNTHTQSLALAVAGALARHRRRLNVRVLLERRQAGGRRPARRHGQGDRRDADRAVSCLCHAVRAGSEPFSPTPRRAPGRASFIPRRLARGTSCILNCVLCPLVACRGRVMTS